MASEHAMVVSSPKVAPFKYSDCVLLKTLLERSDGGLEFLNQRVLVGGWVKTSKEVKKSSPPPVMDEGFEESKTKDVSCVEILQSRIPFFRSIIQLFGGSGYAPRKKVESGTPEPKVESGTPEPMPPQPSTVYLLVIDGSCVASLQVVVDSSVAPPSELLHTGTCILVDGVLKKPSTEGRHVIELEADKVLHIGTVDLDKYPLSKKRVPLDSLRDYAHFRPRTTTVASVMRIRGALSFATHLFFRDHGFLDVQVPTITTTDGEGFSKMFHITTLDRIPVLDQKAEKEKLGTIYETEGVSLDAVKEAAKEKSNLIENLKRTESNREALVAAIQDLQKTNELASQLEAREKKKSGTSSKTDKVDPFEDYFPSQTYLTVSGRLHLESYACALGNVYSFGPTFRADKVDTTKRAAEMWMVEIEMAFAQFQDSLNCATDYFKCLCKWVLENCSEDMTFVAKRIDNSCISRLEEIVSSSPQMVSYNEALDALKKVADIEKDAALTAEHLSFLADNIYKKPIIVYNYPKENKPFYIRLNDDGETVAAFDMVVPKVGTIISGSQEEERLHVISSRIKELGLPSEKYEWYLDLRRNGTVKHSGFTFRFDLMVLFATGLSNVRDVIPFPRSYGKANN